MTDPRDTSLGLDYWLHRCEGFRVTQGERKLGQVRGLRFHGSTEPAFLDVRHGRLQRQPLLIPVDQVERILPDQQLVILKPDTTPPAGTEPDAAA